MAKGSKYRVSHDEDEGEVLPNKLGLTQKEDIEKEEAKGFVQARVNLTSELTDETRIDTEYILEIHRLALGHLYNFAGQLRTVNISKGGFSFPPAKFLEQAMTDFEDNVLHNLKERYNDREAFIDDLAVVHGELLFIHPFRDGNGRTARLLADLMAYKFGYDRLKFERIDEQNLFEEYVHAVQQSGVKNYAPMKKIIELVLD